MNKWIQFVLSASIVLCLSWPSVAQTNPQPEANTALPVLQAFSHNPEFFSEAGGVSPDTNFNCWSSVTLTSSAPSVLLIEAITLTAQVNMSNNCNGESGFGCGGNVVFYDYSTVIGTVPVVNCQPVMIEPGFQTAGRHRLKATFQPPEDHFRESTAYVTIEVDKWPAPTTLSSSVNPSTVGQDVTFSVSITSDIDSPTGKVKFSDGTKAIGIATVDENGNATLTKKNLAVGTHSITAEYYGDSLSAKTTSEVLTQVVNSAASTASLK